MVWRSIDLRRSEKLIYLAIGLILLGLILWFWGVATYARAKGYPAILGICLALLLNILALLVLLVIPDKNQNPDYCVADSNLF